MDFGCRLADEESAGYLLVCESLPNQAMHLALSTRQVCPAALPFRRSEARHSRRKFKVTGGLDHGGDMGTTAGE